MKMTPETVERMMDSSALAGLRQPPLDTLYFQAFRCHPKMATRMDRPSPLLMYPVGSREVASVDWAVGATGVSLMHESLTFPALKQGMYAVLAFAKLTDSVKHALVYWGPIEVRDGDNLLLPKGDMTSG